MGYMQYIWVNEPVSSGEAACAFDNIPICEGYVRELSTGLVYHDVCCLKFHALVCEEVMLEAKAS